MALEVASGVVSITTGAVNTTFTVSGLTFQPKAIVFVWSGVASATIAEADLSAGIGFATSTSARRAYAIQIDTALAANSNRDSVWRNDCCITTLTTAAAVGGHADLDAITSDGFRLIVDDQFPAGFQVGWIAYGGDDITDVAIVDWTERTTNGDTDVATGFALNTGVDNKAVIAVGLRSTAAAGTAASDSTLAVAIAAGNTPVNAVAAISGDDATDPSLTCQYARTGDFIASVGNDTVVSRSTVSAWLADGFRVNTAETDGSAYRRSALVLKGGRFEVGDFTTSTGTSNTAESTTYKPKALFAISGGIAQSASDTTTAAAELSIGVATSASARWAFYVRDADAAGSSDAAHAHTASQFYYNGAATTAVEDGTCDLVSFSADPSNGFTWVMDNADTAGAWVGYLIAADAPLPRSSLPSRFGPVLPPRRGTGSAFVTIVLNDVAAAGALSISGSAGLTATGALAAAGALSITGAAPLFSPGPLAADGALSITGAASLTGFGALATAGSVVISGAADLNGTGALAAAGSVVINGSASLDMDLAAAGSLSIAGAAALTGTGDLAAAAGTLAINGAGSLDGAVTASSLPTRLGPFIPPRRGIGSQEISVPSFNMAAAGSVRVTGSAALTAVGALAAAGSLLITGAGGLFDAARIVGRSVKAVGPFFLMFRRSTMSAAVEQGQGLVAGGSVRITGSAALTATGALAAAGSLWVTGAGALFDAARIVGRSVKSMGPFFLLFRRSTGSAQAAQVGTLNAAGAISINGAAPLTATGTLAATGALSITGVAALGGPSDLSCAGSVTITGAAPLTATGELAATGTVVITGAAPLTASGALAATGTVLITGAAPLTGIGEVASAGSLVINGSAPLGGALNDISAGGSAQITGNATLAAIGALAAAGAVAINGSATLSAVGSLASAGSLVIDGLAALGANNDVSASGVLSIVGAATLTGVGALLAAGTVAITGSGTPSALGALAASGGVLRITGATVISGALAVLSRTIGGLAGRRDIDRALTGRYDRDHGLTGSAEDDS